MCGLLTINSSSFRKSISSLISPVFLGWIKVGAVQEESLTLSHIPNLTNSLTFFVVVSKYAFGKAKGLA